MLAKNINISIYVAEFIQTIHAINYSDLFQSDQEMTNSLEQQKFMLHNVTERYIHSLGSFLVRNWDFIQKGA